MFQNHSFVPTKPSSHHFRFPTNTGFKMKSMIRGRSRSDVMNVGWGATKNQAILKAQWRRHHRVSSKYRASQKWKQKENQSKSGLSNRTLDLCLVFQNGKRLTVQSVLLQKTPGSFASDRSLWRLNFDPTHPMWAPWRDGHILGRSSWRLYFDPTHSMWAPWRDGHVFGLAYVSEVKRRGSTWANSPCFLVNEWIAPISRY